MPSLASSQLASYLVLAASVAAQGGFETPVLQTVLNSTSIDTEPCLSFDGLTLFYYSNRAGGVGGLDIYSSQRLYQGAPWSTPTCETSLSSAQSDYSPFLVIGNVEIYFSSNRTGSTPVTGSTSLSLDIWHSTRGGPGQPWSTPTNVIELNGPGGELQFSMTYDGLECYFLTTGWGNPGGANNSIYRSTRSANNQPWSTPTLVSEIYNGNTHRDVEISGNGLQIIYTEFRPSPVSRLYVYAATRPDRTSSFGVPLNWSEFNNVGTVSGVNSVSLSQQGDELIIGAGFSVAAGNQELLRTRRSVRFGEGCGSAVPLSLGSNAPNVGGNWDLTTSNIDPLSPVSFTFFGFVATALPMDVLGAPGCYANVDQLIGSVTAASVAGTSLLSINVPPALSLVGMVVYTQSACLTASNVLGLFTSNGCASVIGS